MVLGKVFDFKRYSLHDGPGIRTTVFLQGCPLSCWWCHNPESQRHSSYVQYHKQSCLGCEACVETCDQNALQLSPDGIQRDDTHCTTCGDCTDACPAEARSWIGKPLSVAEVLQVVEKDRLYYEDSGGGVTFSGGEPLAQTEFLLEALQACGERELHRAVDTSGLAKTEDLIRVAQHTDLFLFDLKLMNDYLHRQATGVSNRRIIENLHALNEMHPSVRVRVPVIPGINDDIDNFVAMADLLATLEHVRRVDLLPYHSSAREKHNKFGIPWKMNGATGHTQDQLEELAHVIRRPGLQVTIEG